MRRFTVLLVGGLLFPLSLLAESAKESCSFAEETLAYVEKIVKRPKLAIELKRLKARIGNTPDDSALAEEIRGLRRRIIFSHPVLDFDNLLINQRPITAKPDHMVDHYLGRFSQRGPGLVILRNWKDKPDPVFITRDRLPEGTITHPDLSFDAKKVVFAFCEHTKGEKNLRAFKLLEMGIDGSGLRQLTGGGKDPGLRRLGRMTQVIEDFDPCYLPDGGIAFTSTRTMATVRCANYARYNPAFVLHRCEADGSGMRALSFGELNEYEPTVMPDGKLVYTRWEYINRNITTVHGLWTTRPDGTGVEHFYGNNTIDPNVIVEAKPIPDSHKTIALAAAHHAYYRGTVIMIDTEIDEDGLKPLTVITPERSFPEQRGSRFKKRPLVPDENGIYPHGLPYNINDKPAYAAQPRRDMGNGNYAMPFPLNEELYLVCHQEKDDRRYAIYLIDSMGGRELIYKADATDCWAPIPIRPRKRPPVRSSMVTSDPKVTHGTFYIQNVYHNRFDTKGLIKSGSVKAIRINQILDQPAEHAQPRGRVLFETPKRILGTVPVNPDGSTAFRAPAKVPLQLQLLDKHGMAVMSMRSFVYLHPGEVAGCVGCHESRRMAPPTTAPSANIKIHDITPPAWRDYGGGFSFSQTIQPLLDRHCIHCHGLNKDNKLSLIATPETKQYPQTGVSTDWPGKIIVPATQSYLRLLERPGVVKIAQAYNEDLTSRPFDYFAHAGKLAGMLMAKHPDKDGGLRAELDRPAMQRFIDWMDVNAPFAGTYSYNRPENRTILPEGEAALRKHIEQVFGKDLASEPTAALVNVARPESSRILMAPLAKSGGGWGQLAGWKTKSDPRYQSMKKLVMDAIVFSEYRDIAGTCGRGSKNNCLCKACWIREATATK
jgi:hypothetical protein